MANYEHGTREPNDVRVFDGGEDDDGAEGSHLPVVIVISLLVLAAFGGVVWLAYNNGVAHGRADVPTRVATANEPQAVAPGTGDMPPKQIKVYQQPAGSGEDTDQEVATITQAPKVSPAPALRAQPSEAKPEPKVAVPPPIAVAKSTLPPVKLPAKPAAQVSVPAATPPSALALAKPPAKPAIETSVPASAPPTQLLPATAAPKPAELSPSTTVPTPKATEAPARAIETPPKPAAVTVVASPKPAAVTSAAGAYVLQIGAYKSENDANTAWKTYRAKHATLLTGLSQDVQKVDLGGKGVWYRLRVGSFGDKTIAAGLCERLKADGGTCFPAK